MAEPLIVVGLLSGGKDSCYNLCHCAKQGHKIVALATLAPPQGKGELGIHSSEKCDLCNLIEIFSPFSFFFPSPFLQMSWTRTCIKP